MKIILPLLFVASMAWGKDLTDYLPGDENVIAVHNVDEEYEVRRFLRDPSDLLPADLDIDSRRLFTIIEQKQIIGYLDQYEFSSNSDESQHTLLIYYSNRGQRIDLRWLR